MTPIRRVVTAFLAMAVAVCGVVTSVGAQDPSVAAELTDRSPWVDVGGTLTVDLALTDAVDAVAVQVHGRLDDVDELEASRHADEGPVIFTGVFARDTATPLSDGAVRYTFDISDTVNEDATIRMAYAGVYPVVITPLDVDGNPGEAIRTPVVRRSGAGTDLAAPTLSFVVDVSTRPTATAEGQRRALGADEVARLGRLGRFVRRAVDADVPVTALVNTDTLTALADSDDVGAAELYAVLSDPGVVAAPQPTVPIDWPVLSAAGLDGLIPEMVERGRRTVADVAATVDDSLWDGRGGMDEASFGAVADAGFRRVLVTPGSVDHTSLSPRGGLAAHAPPGLDVVAVDHAAAELLTSATDSREEVLAELVLRGSAATASVVVIDDVASGSMLAVALESLTGPDAPVTVAPLDVSPDDRTLVDVSEPDGDESTELRDLAPAVTAALESLDLYRSVAGADGAAVVDDATDLLAGALQRGLRSDERALLIAGVDQLTSWVADDVAFVGPGDLNLTSRSGTLPIGVVNDGTTTLRLVLAARSDRLRFPEGTSRFRGGESWTEIVVDVVPGESRLDLPVEALATGSVPLHVELRAPDGSVVVPARQYNVRSTAVSGVGLVLSIGALTVLVVWWFRTWRRSRRERV